MTQIEIEQALQEMNQSLGVSITVSLETYQLALSRLMHKNDNKEGRVLFNMALASVSTTPQAIMIGRILNAINFATETNRPLRKSVWPT